MNNLFRRRSKATTAHDIEVRRDTRDVLIEHRRVLGKVRTTLSSANETIADEIRRLDRVLEKR